MDNYKNKYLKYKNKYLDLKTRLTGGAECPTLGFYQHRGECWHDALSMILLYSNGLSENIQAMFNSEHFSAEECIQQAIGNPQLEFLLPKNIEPKDYGEFIDYAKVYISQLQSRYLNDKLPIKPITKIKNIEPEAIKLFRKNSIEETMACTNMIFNIANINLNESRVRNDINGGNIWHNITVILLFNYFLLNYLPNYLPKQLDPVRQLKFINMNIIYIYQRDIDYPNIVSLIDFLIKGLLVLNTKLDNCIGIFVDLRNRLELDINTVRTEAKIIGHAVAFIKCDDKLYFYDDNGVLEGEPIVAVNPIVALNSDVVEFRNTAPTLLIEFNWIKYLKQKIIEAIPRLKELMSLKDAVELSQVIEVMLIFSEFIDIHNLPMHGRQYLENTYISRLQIITLENLSTEAHYNETIGDINIIYKMFYTNKRVKEILIKE
jgi:hypothetical protein